MRIRIHIIATFTPPPPTPPQQKHLPVPFSTYLYWIQVQETKLMRIRIHIIARINLPTPTPTKHLLVPVFNSRTTIIKGSCPELPSVCGDAPHRCHPL